MAVGFGFIRPERGMFHSGSSALICFLFATFDLFLNRDKLSRQINDPISMVVVRDTTVTEAYATLHPMAQRRLMSRTICE